MKISDRIKKIRYLTGMTGKKVSELSGINHSLIKKYETSRAVPKSNHISKLANALDVSEYAINGTNSLRFHTVGDIYGLLFMLDNIGLISITKNDVDFVSIELNELFTQFFDLRLGLENQDWTKYNILINGELKKDDFLQWIAKKDLYKSCKGKENVEKSFLDNLEYEIEELELTLQQITDKLELKQ